MPSIKFAAAKPVAAKVPEITAMFWVIKILTTGMGEAMSDFLGQTFIPLAALIGVGGMYYGMKWQFQRTEYHAPTYWFCVWMVAIFGTMAADGIHDGAMLPYSVTTPLWAIAVGVVFYKWHKSEGTLDIHSITTVRREKFYWAAVLATFALGTAAGDLTAIQLNIGFFPSALVFLGVILVPALVWWAGKLNGVVAFWACYVVTRPLGASFADWFGKPVKQSGLNLGDGPTSGLMLLVFLALVAYVAKRRNDIQKPDAHTENRHHPHMALHGDASAAEA